MSTSNLNIFVPATGTPVHVSSAYASDFQIANNSTNPVWVGGDSSVSVSSGLLLNPGGATTWGGGQDLWAVSTKGSSGMVTCLFNASGSYTPGPTSIGISGTVPTTQGNLPTLLALWGTTIAAGVVFPAGLPLAFSRYSTATQNDVSAYASVIFRVTMTPTIGTSNAVGNITNYLHLDTWFSQFQGTGSLYDSMGYNSAEWLYTNQYSNNISFGQNWQAYTLQVPVTNQFVNLSAKYFAGVGLANQFDVQVQVYGSHQTVDSIQYVNQSSDLITAAPSGLAFSQIVSAVASSSYLVESNNGPGFLGFLKANGQATQTATCTMSQLSGGASSIISATGFAAGTASGTEFLNEVFFPSRPILVNPVISVIAGNCVATVSQ